MGFSEFYSVPDGRTYKRANNVCVNCFLTHVKSLPNFTLFVAQVNYAVILFFFGKYYGISFGKFLDFSFLKQEQS